MRDYSKIPPSFWSDPIGRAIRGDADAQIVALYLLTSPHANMIGVFECPLVYISHDTGSSIEGASKGLKRLIEAGFCKHAAAADLVWVIEMAENQIGDGLKPGDNRVKAVQKLYEKIPEATIKQAFFARYGRAYGLTQHGPLTSGTEAPSKGLQRGFDGPSKPVTVAVAVEGPIQEGSGSSWSDTHAQAYGGER